MSENITLVGMEVHLQNEKGYLYIYPLTCLVLKMLPRNINIYKKNI